MCFRKAKQLKAKALRQEASDDGGISQSARHTPNPELRRAAVSARRQEKDAKKYAMWASEGWTCSPWQKKQIILLETGELAKQVRSANAAYGLHQPGAQRIHEIRRRHSSDADSLLLYIEGF